jgi:hypothetical protein
MNIRLRRYLCFFGNESYNFSLQNEARLTAFQVYLLLPVLVLTIFVAYALFS